MKICNSSDGGYYAISTINRNVVAIMRCSMKIFIFLCQFCKIFSVTGSGLEGNTVHNTKVKIIFVKCCTTLLTVKNARPWRNFILHKFTPPSSRLQPHKSNFSYSFPALLPVAPSLRSVRQSRRTWRQDNRQFLFVHSKAELELSFGQQYPD